MLVAVVAQVAVLDQHHQLVADQVVADQVTVVTELQTVVAVVAVVTELTLVTGQALEQAEQAALELLL